MTRIPAPLLVWLPRFSVPSVKRIGYMGASKKNNAMTHPTPLRSFSTTLITFSTMHALANTIMIKSLAKTVARPVPAKRPTVKMISAYESKLEDSAEVNLAIGSSVA